MKLLVLLVPALALAACGTRPVQTAGPAVTPAHSPTADDNRQAAGREAGRLLSLTPLPYGAASTSTRPPLLSGPALGSVADASLIDRSSFWRVGLPADQALAWITANPPRGLSPTGSSTFGSRATKAHGLGFGAKDTDAWESAQLQIGIAPDGASSSVIRADGTVVWLDPRPNGDSLSGPRLRVTVADGCPANTKPAVGVANPDQPDLDARLLPPGSPTAGLACDYAGFSRRLTGHRTLDATAAERLARAARDLPLSHSLGGPRSCPLDSDTVAVIVFSYLDRPDVDLWLHATGCPSVSNGHIWTEAGALRDAYSAR
jgi:hypothetical protein